MQKILVIEDEDVLRANILELLEVEGYQVWGGRDGEEGLQLAWQILPDLIVCDILMPRLDGYGVLQRLRQDPTTANIPVIFLTALSDRFSLRKGMVQGGDDYIPKPFTLTELLQAIEVRLHKKAALTQEAQKRLVDARTSIYQGLPEAMLSSLSVILSFSQLLENGEVSEAVDVRSVGRNVRMAAERLLSTTRKYMDYIELDRLGDDAKRLAALQESITSTAMIGELAAVRAAACGRPADLRVEIETAQLAMDVVYVQRLVDELLENAFKFSQADTPVEIAGRVNLSHWHYVLTVSDQGRGIAEEQLAALQGAIPAEKASYTQQFAGVGLAFVRRVVELHGGRMAIRSTERIGTQVSLILPLVPKVSG